MQTRAGFLVFSLLVLSFAAAAQGVGVGTTTPAASAALDVTSTSGGVLLSRMTAAQRDAIASPAQGLLVFQTDGTPGLYYYLGNSWLNLASNIVPDANGAAGADPRIRVSTFASQLTGGVSGMALDGNGNLYVTVGHAIYRTVLATGVVSQFAGNGISGSSNNPPAQFASPQGLALDGSGTFLYVADDGNHSIRKIEVATRQVTTLAGGTSGTADGTGPAAQFFSLSGMAVNSGGTYAYVSDQNRIRTIELATGVVTTLAGSSTTSGLVNGRGPGARFYSPKGLTLDASGTILYVADLLNHCIRKIVVATRQVTTLAGSSIGYADGTGTAAQFNYPTDVAVDGSGNVYVADAGNACIRKIVGATGSASTLAGTNTTGNIDGTGPNARFAGPICLALDGSGTLYVYDNSNENIRVVK